MSGAGQMAFEDVTCCPRAVRGEVGIEQLKVDLARISERLNHVPTRIEFRSDVDAAIDRAASRTQRTVAVAGGLVTLAVAAMNYLPKLLY